MDLEKLKEWATDRQIDYIDAIIEHGSQRKAATALDISHQVIGRAIRAIKRRAAKQGYSPDHDMTHTAPESHIVKGVSTLYGDDGQVKQQWVRTDINKSDQAEALIAFTEGLASDLKGVHQEVDAPELYDESLMSCYIIGDHHMGMLAHAAITGADDYNIHQAESLLVNAVDKLVSRGSCSHTALLVNLGDFLHANDASNLTQSGHVLDVDGHFARAFEAAGRTFRIMIHRMLQTHKEVVVLNARGNHDRDSSLMLNILLKTLYADDPRVVVLDNVSKFVSYKFGKNLIVTHHGDKINPQRVYEHVTRSMAKDWGNTEHRFCWMGHIHHKEAKEIGGMLCESWNVLAPVDSWHADSGYGSSRSMSCVVLHKEFGEEVRHKVGIKHLQKMVK